MTADLTTRLRERPDDQARWEAWYKALYPRAYYAAYRFANGRVDQARDLVQESFARFLDYGALERITDDRHALWFLIKTCQNLAIDLHARKTPAAETLELLPDLPAPESQVDSEIDFARLLQMLDPQDQELLLWTRDGFSVSEIAQKLAITYTAAGVRLHRLKKRLSELWARSR